MKKTFLAPLDKHSKPNEPIPEYKSKTLRFFNLLLVNFECSKIYQKYHQFNPQINI